MYDDSSSVEKRWFRAVLSQLVRFSKDFLTDLMLNVEQTFFFFIKA